MFSFITSFFSDVWSGITSNPVTLYALIAIAFLHTFFALYVLATALYRAHLDKVLTKVGYVFGYPWLLLAVLVDFFAQFTIFIVIFLELPREFLVTQRLRRHLDNGEEKDGWRWRVAHQICSKVLDYFDPRGSHCIPPK